MIIGCLKHLGQPIFCIHFGSRIFIHLGLYKTEGLCYNYFRYL